MNEHRINLGPTGRTEIVANTITKFRNKVKDIDLSKTDLYINYNLEDIEYIDGLNKYIEYKEKATHE